MWLHGQLGLNEESILIDFDLWIRERVKKDLQNKNQFLRFEVDFSINEALSYKYLGQLGLNKESILIDFDLWIRKRVNKMIYKTRIRCLDLRSAVVDFSIKKIFLVSTLVS